MKNVMFRDAPIPTPNKSAFDLSHEKKFSCQIGRLIPFFWAESVPGDKWKIKSEILAKFSPLMAPVLHRIDVHIHYFKIPYRLLMNKITNTYAGWTDFITGDPDSHYINEELPFVTISNATKAQFVESSLADYLGLPVISPGTTVTQDVDINVLPAFAYHLIYDHYYRDENLQARSTTTELGGAGTIDLVGGDRTAEIGNIFPTLPLLRSHEKDYFRGALSTAYTGAASDVELNLDLTGRVAMGISVSGLTDPDVGDVKFPGTDNYLESAAAADLYYNSAIGSGTAVLEIMELRRVQSITRWLEAERRGGIRYQEMLLGVWGVISDNAELDVPEYIGGGKQAVQISSNRGQAEVLDPTEGADGINPGPVVTINPGSFETGSAYASGSGNYANTYCKEHSIIMGIMSVLPRTAYGGAQIERFWRKMDREDFFVPQLQNIGDQAILTSEINYDATGVDMDDVWGYAPRWAEYKFKNSTIHSEFLSTLDYWHMGYIGDTAAGPPTLSSAWVHCNYLYDENIRIFADQTAADKLYVEIYNDVLAIRPMYVHDIPK